MKHKIIVDFIEKKFGVKAFEHKYSFDNITTAVCVVDGGVIIEVHNYDNDKYNTQVSVRMEGDDCDLNTATEAVAAALKKLAWDKPEAKIIGDGHRFDWVIKETAWSQNPQYLIDFIDKMF